MTDNNATPNPLSGKSMSRNAKIRDFLFGFLGWYGVNGIFWRSQVSAVGYNSVGMLAMFCLPANLICMIILASKLRWVALGMLASYAVNFLLSLIVGTLINGLCWIPFFVK